MAGGGGGLIYVGKSRMRRKFRRKKKNRGGKKKKSGHKLPEILQQNSNKYKKLKDDDRIRNEKIPVPGPHRCKYCPDLRLSTSGSESGYSDTEDILPIIETSLLTPNFSIVPMMPLLFGTPADEQPREINNNTINLQNNDPMYELDLTVDDDTDVFTHRAVDLYSEWYHPPASPIEIASDRLNTVEENADSQDEGIDVTDEVIANQYAPLLDTIDLKETTQSQPMAKVIYSEPDIEVIEEDVVSDEETIYLKSAWQTEEDYKPRHKLLCCTIM